MEEVRLARGGQRKELSRWLTEPLTEPSCIWAQESSSAHDPPFFELRVCCWLSAQFYKKGGAAGGEQPMPDFGGAEQAGGGAAAGPKVEEVD